MRGEEIEDRISAGTRIVVDLVHRDRTTGFQGCEREAQNGWAAEKIRNRSGLAFGSLSIDDRNDVRRRNSFLVICMLRFATKIPIILGTSRISLLDVFNS